MALDTSAKLRAAIKQSYGLQPRGPQVKNSLVFSQSLWTKAPVGGSTWATGANAVAAPGETVDNTTVGAFPIPDPVTGKKRYLVRARAHMDTFSDGWLMLIDRLVQVGSLVGNVTTAQTINSVALPARATGGDGIWAMMENYAAPAGSPGNATISYTNQAGTAGRTTIATAASTNGQVAALLPLQAGDTGVRSVQSFTLSAAGTSAGNIGITLFRPVLIGLYAPQDDSTTQHDWTRDWRHCLQPVDDAACLAALSFNVTVSGADPMLDLGFAFA